MYKLDNTDGVKSHGLLIASVNSWLTNEAKPVQRRLRTKCTAVFIERETGVLYWVHEYCWVLSPRLPRGITVFQLPFSLFCHEQVVVCVSRVYQLELHLSFRTSTTFNKLMQTLVEQIFWKDYKSQWQYEDEKCRSQRLVIQSNGDVTIIQTLLVTISAYAACIRSGEGCVSPRLYQISWKNSDLRGSQGSMGGLNRNALHHHFISLLPKRPCAHQNLPRCHKKEVETGNESATTCRQPERFLLKTCDPAACAQTWTELWTFRECPVQV